MLQILIARVARLHGMIQKLVLVLLCIGCLHIQAQSINSNSFHIGFNHSYYMSTLNGNGSYYSFCMPQTSVELMKHNENKFWAGVGLGGDYKRIPFYRDRIGAYKVGIECTDLWLRVRSGITIQRQQTAHLPFISLGISGLTASGVYSQSSNNTTTYYGKPDSLKAIKRFQPFVELGWKIIPSSFTDDHHNIPLTFALRYNPLPVFDSPQKFVYDPTLYYTIQYQMLELSMNIGLQYNAN